MKTMKDFKGSKGDFVAKDNLIFANVLTFSIATIHTCYRWDVLKGIYVKDIEMEANAKLFAASKKLLEAAIDAKSLIERMAALISVYREIDINEFNEYQKLEQAINEAL